MKKIVGILVIGLLIATLLPIGSSNININKKEVDTKKILLEKKLIGIGSISIDTLNKIEGFVFIGINNGQIIIAENIDIQCFLPPVNLLAGISFVFYIKYNPAIDADGDGYYAEIDDCDDTDATINPDATEVCDEVDNDCDGDIDEGVTITFYHDFDGDGYGNPSDKIQACSCPGGFVDNPYDCDDDDYHTHPGATEICGDGIDNNCDGYIEEDC